jgi:hypothetical protein
MAFAQPSSPSESVLCVQRPFAACSPALRGFVQALLPGFPLVDDARGLERYRYEV